MGFSGKLKRKEIDQVNDDFSDFSLSSPATKIRRLDVDLPPIIEEEEYVPENQERAIILFNPLHNNDNNCNTPLLRSPSNLSISLNSDLISGFKSQFLRSSDLKSAYYDEAKYDDSNKASEGCLAVVPWVPSRVTSIQSRDGELEVPDEAMETDEMDVEDDNGNNVRMEQEHGYEFGGLRPSENVHHWTQQHCLIPQPPQNRFTPITWSQ